MNGRLGDGAPRAFAVTYLLIEGCAIACYWLALWLFPDTRSAFMPAGAPSASLWSLLPAEVGLVVCSLLSVFAIHRRAAWATPVLWLHAGAAVYASLFAVGMAVVEPRLWPGAGLMLPVLVVPPALAWSAQFPGVSNSEKAWRCVLRTGVQTVLFWCFFLLIVPVLLRRAEVALGWLSPSLDVQMVKMIGIAVFAAAGALGLWSGWTLAVIGRGTPLPLDPARHLVIAGPYRFVRNPMALSGVMQGVSVGLWCGSWLVIGYALCGALLWHVVVRPQEELELAERFGDEYVVYRRTRRCWLPGFGPLPRS